MNVGYSKFGDLNNPVNNKTCPICGKDIYISKYHTNFACVDVNCALGHGAKDLISKIQGILDLLNNKPEIINKRKIELLDGEIHTYYTKGEKNPCGCGSNCYHLEDDGKTILGVCNACGDDIYELKEYSEFKEWKYKN